MEVGAVLGIGRKGAYVQIPGKSHLKIAETGSAGSFLRQHSCCEILRHSSLFFGAVMQIAA